MRPPVRRICLPHDSVCTSDRSDEISRFESWEWSVRAGWWRSGLVLGRCPRLSLRINPPQAGLTLKSGDHRPRRRGDPTDAQRPARPVARPSTVDGDFGEGTRVAALDPVPEDRKGSALDQWRDRPEAPGKRSGRHRPADPPVPPPAVVNAADHVAKQAGRLVGRATIHHMRPPGSSLDGRTGAVLWGSNEASSSREPASTTKMMTALVVASAGEG